MLNISSLFALVFYVSSIFAAQCTREASAPRGPFDCPYARELRAVGEHAIAAPGIWENKVGPALLNVLDEEKVKWDTIDVHRIHYVELDDEAPFPVVVCIGVQLGVLSGEEGAPVAKRCQQVLDSFGLNDVEVAIKVSNHFQSVGPAPAFEEAPRSISLFDPVGSLTLLRMPFTSSVGFPLSSKGHPTVEGSSGFFFINGSDTSKVYLLTARHVVIEASTRDKNAVYDHSSANKPRRRDVTVFNEAGIAEHMESIRMAIGSQSREMDVYQDWIDEQQDEVDKTQGKDLGAVRELKETQGLIKKALERSKALEKRYEDVAKLYLSQLGRTLGFVSYSPPFGFSLGEHKYTEDVAIIEVDADKINADTFRPNVLHLDVKFESKIMRVLIRMLRPAYEDCCHSPSLYPPGRLLQLSGILPDSELREPKEKDTNGGPAGIVVLKQGKTSGLTLGRVNNVPSYTRTYWEDGTSDVSMEWPVFSYRYDDDDDDDDITMAFSGPGDSGSVVVDGMGRIAGIITSGSGYRRTVDGICSMRAVADVTYMTAAEFIRDQMRTRGIDMNVDFTLT